MTDRQRLTSSPVGPAEAGEFLRGRRSVDQFESTPVDTGRLEEAFEVARWAPNHHLTEPWQFYVIGPETKKAIVELNAELVAEAKGEEAADAKRQRWHAVPGWFAVTCRRADDANTAAEDYAACACAAHNIVLYLHSAGMACKWTSGPVTHDARYLRLLGADPANDYSVGLFWYGVAKRAPRTQRSEDGHRPVRCP
ncbi:nitroreductase family protein [Salinisphaera orenii]|uniref:nitroreductase family protein n=1 Tax=Salinisphaera orenii TaxID=856731 RepID=UPI000DBEA127